MFETSVYGDLRLCPYFEYCRNYDFSFTLFGVLDSCSIRNGNELMSRRVVAPLLILLPATDIPWRDYALLLESILSLVISTLCCLGLTTDYIFIFFGPKVT